MNNTQAYKELELDGESYTITLFPADQGVKILSKLIKLVGEPLAELAASNGDMNKVFDILPLAMKSLTEKLYEDEVFALCKHLSSAVIKKSDGSVTLDKNFNNHFKGRYGHMMKLLKEVVEFNYSDFLDVLPIAPKKGESAPVNK